jgi:hypothetical protein
VIAEPGAPAPGDPTDTTTTVPPTTTTDPAATTTTTAPPTALPPGAIDGKPPTGTNGLAIVGRRCADSKLAPHEGFQDPKSLCVDTAMGEVAAEDRLPSLLITAAPKTVAVDQAFMIEVSTRNLVRDRFLGAAVGGYYLESSFLNDAGLQRGHFHTACRILASTTAAPDSSKAPEFFLATQDGGGGTGADTVTIPVPGIKTAGELQCTSWAGDGSHRTPMMSRANQTPAIDSVRITVGGNAPAGAVASQPDVNAADAKADAAAQTEAQAKEEASQKPDQDGAPQPGADDTLPGGAAAPAADPAPADAPAADPAPADSSDADAPATATEDAGN